MNWKPGDCNKCILKGTIICTECPYRKENK